MSDPERRALWRSALRRSARDPNWLGYWLARFRRHEGLRLPELARRLGIDVRRLVLLSTCRTPREGTFVEDLDVVCRHVGANKFVLANVLRQEQALAGWQESPPGQRGWLAAASDDEPDDQAEDAESPDER